MDDTVKTRYSVLKYLYRPHQVIELSQSKDPRNKEEYHKVENTADGLALAVELLHDGVTGLLKELHVYRGFILQERVNFSYSVPSWCPAHPSITSTESPFRIKIVCSSRNIAVWYDSPVSDGDSQNAKQAEYKKVYGNFQLNMQDVESTAKIVAAFEQFQQRNPNANLKVSRQNKPNAANTSGAAGTDSQNKRQKLTGSPALDTQMLESQQQFSQTSSAGRDTLFHSKYIQPSPTARLATSSPTQLSDSGFASEAFKIPAPPRVNALRGVHMLTPSSSPPPPSTSQMDILRQQASSPSSQNTAYMRVNSPLPGLTSSVHRMHTSSPVNAYMLSVHDATLSQPSTYRPNIAYLESQASTYPYQQATQYEYNQPSFAIYKDRDAFLFDTQSQTQQQEASFATTAAGQTQLQHLNAMDSYTFPPKLNMTQESSMQIDDEATEHTMPPTRANEAYASRQTPVETQQAPQYKDAGATDAQSQSMPASILAMEAALSSRNKNLGSQTQTQPFKHEAVHHTFKEPLHTVNSAIPNDGANCDDQNTTNVSSNGAVGPDDQMSTNPMTAADIPQIAAITQDTSIQIEDTIRDFTSLNPTQARDLVLAVLGDPNFATMVNMVYRMPEFRMAG